MTLKKRSKLPALVKRMPKQSAVLFDHHKKIRLGPVSSLVLEDLNESSRKKFEEIREKISGIISKKKIKLSEDEIILWNAVIELSKRARGK